MITTGVRLAVETRGTNQRGAVRSALLAGAVGVAGVVGGLSVTRAISELSSEPTRWGFTWSVSLDEGDGGATVAVTRSTINGFQRFAIRLRESCDLVHGGREPSFQPPKTSNVDVFCPG